MISDIPPAAEIYRRELIGEARFAFGLDAPIALLAGQITQESGFDPRVCSRAGACGLAQFMPGTAKWISGAYASLRPAAPLDSHWAIRAMVTYDKSLYDAVKPANTDCDRWKFTLSDYSGGTRWRVKRQAMSPQPGDYTISAAFNPGITKANQQENADYPFKITYQHQPVFASWSSVMICLPKVG